MNEKKERKEKRNVSTKKRERKNTAVFAGSLLEKRQKISGHRPERRGNDARHHHLGSRLSTTCIIGASSEFTQI